MTRWIAALLAALAITSATTASAQEAVPGPGAVVVTLIPGGATFFTEAEDNPLAPSFGSYDLGAGVAVHFGRVLSLEGEVSGALGVSQSLQIGVSEFVARRLTCSTTAATLSWRAAASSAVRDPASAG